MEASRIRRGVVLTNNPSVMKRYTFLLPFALLISCAVSSDKHPAAAPDSAKVIIGEDVCVDSSSADSGGYNSAVLKLFGLRGAVRTVATIGDNTGFTTCLSKTLVFDADGRLTSDFAGYSENKLTPGDDGLLLSTSCRDKTGSICTLEFTRRDTHGNPLEAVYTSEGQNGRIRGVVSYKYEQFDDRGNWLRRSLKGYTSRSGSADGDSLGESDSAAVCNIQTRTITYY